MEKNLNTTTAAAGWMLGLLKMKAKEQVAVTHRRGRERVGPLRTTTFDRPGSETGEEIAQACRHQSTGWNSGSLCE